MPTPASATDHNMRRTCPHDKILRQASIIDRPQLHKPSTRWIDSREVQNELLLAQNDATAAQNILSLPSGTEKESTNSVEQTNAPHKEVNEHKTGPKTKSTQNTFESNPRVDFHRSTGCARSSPWPIDLPSPSPPPKARPCRPPPHSTAGLIDKQEVLPIPDPSTECTDPCMTKPFSVRMPTRARALDTTSRSTTAPTPPPRPSCSDSSASPVCDSDKRSGRKGVPLPFSWAGEGEGEGERDGDGEGPGATFCSGGGSAGGSVG